jgi:hypothetical protein
MKVKELFEEEEEKVDAKFEIESWLFDNKVQAWVVNDDLSINVDGSVIIEQKLLKSLPYKFNRVNGAFSVYRNDLKSMENCPSYVGRGDFSVEANYKIKDFKGSPRVVNGDYSIIDTSITSFHDIHKHIDTINGDLLINQRVKDSVLGLLKIRGLKKVLTNYPGHLHHRNHPIFNIVNKYLPEGNIIECQSELIEAGLDNWAKL